VLRTFITLKKSIALGGVWTCELLVQCKQVNHYTTDDYSSSMSYGEVFKQYLSYEYSSAWFIIKTENLPNRAFWDIVNA
jgi:hypothetical protein